MIVRNEERFLPGCLESVRGLVDEIIVVDTGSTDRTAEIARSFGARVFDFEWRDDFSAARNESLRHAGSDWILYLDADERIDCGGIDNCIRAAAAHPDFDAFSVLIRNFRHTASERPAFDAAYNFRLFRNFPGICS